MILLTIDVYVAVVYIHNKKYIFRVFLVKSGGGYSSVGDVRAGTWRQGLTVRSVVIKVKKHFSKFFLCTLPLTL